MLVETLMPHAIHIRRIDVSGAALLHWAIRSCN